MDALKQKIAGVTHGHSSTEHKPASVQTVLITAASDFIAWFGLRRAPTKVKKMHLNDANSLSFVIVPDLTIKGAFDQAVQGVDGFIHIASPFVVQGVDAEMDLLMPAIEGTKSVLKSVAVHSPNVKRVVVTSSFAAIINMHKGTWPEPTCVESDWNPETYKGAERVDLATAYCASKALAEKVALGSNAAFSRATIWPPMVYGPVEYGITDSSKLDTSAAEKAVPPTACFGYADVRDVAHAHLKAYKVPAAANQCFLITGGNYSCQQVCDILREMPETKDGVPEGMPGSGRGQEVYKFDNSKSWNAGHPPSGAAGDDTRDGKELAEG